jgi:hypothetical protein
MFNQPEVQILLGSANLPIDLGDLRKHTNYEGLHNDAINAFWAVSAISKASYCALMQKSPGCQLFRSGAATWAAEVRHELQ